MRLCSVINLKTDQVLNIIKPCFQSPVICKTLKGLALNFCCRCQLRMKSFWKMSKVVQSFPGRCVRKNHIFLHTQNTRNNLQCCHVLEYDLKFGKMYIFFSSPLLQFCQNLHLSLTEIWVSGLTVPTCTWAEKQHRLRVSSGLVRAGDAGERILGGTWTEETKTGLCSLLGK